MYISTAGTRPRALLLCGVPLPVAELEPGQGLVLRDESGTDLPIWWEERAYWPDKSVKWIFLHARLSSNAARLALYRGKEIVHQDVMLNRGIVIGDTELRFQDSGWTFTTDDQSVSVYPGRVRTDSEMLSNARFDLSLVEASPIAPLLRWRQPDGEGLYFDHLLRIDPERGQLHWQQRLSFGQPDLCHLNHLSATVRFSGDAQWTFASGATRNLLVPRPGHQIRDGGPEQTGHPEARVEDGCRSVILGKGWQRAPFSLAADGSEIHIGFYPADVPALPVHSGTSFRHHVRLGTRGYSDPTARWSLDAELACATGAFGPLMAKTDKTQRLFPGYEQAIQAGFDGARHSRLDKIRGEDPGPATLLQDETNQDEEYFGLQHYGDWPMSLGSYGGNRRMYADNEYDTPYAFILQFIRSGQTAYADVAYHSAVHMADVDCKCTDGDMHYHGYRDQADDHGLHRTKGGDLGHYWTDGLMLNHLLFDDIWSWESGISISRHISRVFSGEGDDTIRQHFLGCERSVGWPLTALCGVAEVFDDPHILAKMGQMVGFLARFSADPDRELEEVTEVDGQPIQWWRIGQEDGSKPFMLGVVLEGLERYYRITRDPAAGEAAVNICRFLVDVMWVEHIEAFVYEWNAFNRAHREDVYPHYINMMVAPGLAFAHELTGEERFRQIATRAFHAALWTLFAPGGGKEIGMVGRTSGLMVGRLHAWRMEDERIRDLCQRPSSGKTFVFQGHASDLNDSPDLSLSQGGPIYREGALHSSGDSFSVYEFRDPVSTEAGEIAFEFIPDWNCPPHPGPVSQRAYLHLSDIPFTKCCVSIISFYTGLHIRFYDSERNYIEVLETDIQTWTKHTPVRVQVTWSVSGEAALHIDGEERDRRVLNRRLSGAFRRLHVGHRPGNWRSDGWINDLEMRFGP